MLAVVASRTRLTVRVSGSRRARARIRGPSVSGQACSGWTRPCRTRSWKSARMTSARSIWSQAAAKFSPIGPSSVPRLMAVSQEPGGLRLVRVGAGAGVLAQLGLEVRADRAGLDEADQAAGEVRFLGPGGQPDGQPPGGDVVDDGAAAVGVGDAVVDEALVQGGGRGAARARAAGSRVLPGRYAVIGLIHGSCGVSGRRGAGHVPLGGAGGSVLGWCAGSGCSIGCLAVGLPAGVVLLAVDVAGRLGGLRDRVGCGQAEFCRPSPGCAARAGAPRAGRARRRCRPGSSR